MTQKTKFSHKAMALFLVLAFLPSIIPVNYVYANGPTAPEAASFEPVDATDMVNLATGDLSYVLPLLHVPSPEGGYPISLSYHAGISMGQEASWVGLGWNLNPGAINRSVSGYPDDWKTADSYSVAYDIGGTQTFHEIDASVGWGEGKYSAGLYASYVENKAYGGETTYDFILGAQAGIGKFNVRAGNDGVGIGYRNVGEKGTASVGINHSFKNGATSATFSYQGHQKKESNDISEFERFTDRLVDNRANNLFASSYSNLSGTTSGEQMGLSFSFNFTAKLFNLNYNYKKIRYWYFDSKAYQGAGSLYAKEFSDYWENSNYTYNSSFDVYQTNYDPTNPSLLLDNNISYVSYDKYSASGQGIGGNFSPVINDYGSLLQANKSVVADAKENKIIKINAKPFTNQIGNNVYFYFDNVNESYLKTDADVWGATPTAVNDITEIIPPNENKITTVNINGDTYNTQNNATNRKRTGSIIDVYTNAEIQANQNLILNSDIKGFDRFSNYVPTDGIGAYKITLADGKTYHYTVPVYQNEKFSRTGKFTDNLENKFYEEIQVKPYATHWLLTAITGPDFVDNGDNKVSKGDLGYWVSFEYGKWSDGYSWRTPVGNDYSTSINSKSTEWGNKEIYYLDAIKTRTHTALFVKEERLDNMARYRLRDNAYSSIMINYLRGGFGKDSNFYLKGLTVEKNLEYSDEREGRSAHQVKLNTERRNHSTLKLSKIILLKNEVISNNILTTNPNQSDPVISSKIDIQERLESQNRAGLEFYDSGWQSVYTSEYMGQFYGNVLDTKDLHQSTNVDLEKKALKVIDFKHSYELSPSSPNSFSADKGKLTLDKVFFHGKEGKSFMPPYSFSYKNPSVDYNLLNLDNWGYVKNNPAAWSLNKIVTPTGGSINITYESDDYDREAVSNDIIFQNELKFQFTRANNIITGTMKNIADSNPNNIDFRDYFELGSNVNFDLWAAVEHKYRPNPFDCHRRLASIDLNSNNLISITEVSHNQLKFQFTEDYMFKDNDGEIYLFYGTGPNEKGPEYWSLEMDDLQDKARGDFPNQISTCKDDRFALKYRISPNRVLNSGKNEGGIRVSKIGISDGNKQYETNYYYNEDGYSQNPNDAGYKSSGITSYAPSKHPKSIKYIAEIPGPTVFYNTVTVEKENIIKKYYFKTIPVESETATEYALGDILQIKFEQNDKDIDLTVNNVGTKLSKSKIVVHNNFSMIGTLLSQQILNKEGQALEKTLNNYAQLNLLKQGTSQESFNTYSRVRNNDDNTWNFHLNTTSKVTYPKVLNNTIQNQAGFGKTSFFKKHDFLTGQVLETITTNSKGEDIRSTLVPAYTKYFQMGSKVDNLNNRNMLTQEALSYTEIKVGDTWRKVAASINTWKNWGNSVWRKHQNHTWNGSSNAEGWYENYSADDDGFVWTDTNNAQPANTEWRLNSEITKYDAFSMPLEVLDINNNRSATKMGDNDTKIFASGNAGYDRIYYSGAEDIDPGGTYFGGGVQKGTAIPTSDSHTGGWALAISPGQTAFNVTIVNGSETLNRYKVSLWAKANNYQNARISVDNGPGISFNPDEIVHAGNWVQLNFYTPINNTQTLHVSANGGNTIVDDFRVHPVHASLTSYVYNKWDELTHILGPNNMGIAYQYDSGGRLIETKTEVADFSGLGSGGFKKTSETDYTYKY